MSGFCVNQFRTALGLGKSAEACFKAVKMPVTYAASHSSTSDKLHHEGIYKWEKVVWNSLLSRPGH